MSKCTVKIEIPFIKTPEFHSKNITSSSHLFPILIDLKMLNLSKKQVMDKLRLSGIGSQVHYIPIPLQPYYKNNPNKFLSVEIPNALKLYEEELSIPMHVNLTNEDMQHVVKSISNLKNHP